MDRRTRNVFAFALIAVVGLAGATALLLSGSPSPSGPPTDAPAVVGVVVGVESGGLGDVRSFALRGEDGSITTFSLADLRNPTQFPPGHLAEHQATAEPIRVFYRFDGTTHAAIWLEDAEDAEAAETPVTSASASITTPSSTPGETSSVEGVVVAVQVQGEGDVRSFDVRADDGSILTFALDDLENGDEFPPIHLEVHEADGYPVRVFYRDVGGTLQAIRLEDGEPPASP